MDEILNGHNPRGDSRLMADVLGIGTPSGTEPPTPTADALWRDLWRDVMASQITLSPQQGAWVGPLPAQWAFKCPKLPPPPADPPGVILGQGDYRREWPEPKNPT